MLCFFGVTSDEPLELSLVFGAPIGDCVVVGGFSVSFFAVGSDFFIVFIMLLEGLFLIVFVRICSLFRKFSTALSSSFSVSKSSPSSSGSFVVSGVLMFGLWYGAGCFSGVWSSGVVG